MRVLIAILTSAAIAALVSLPVRSAAPKPVEHWHYLNCDRIIHRCLVG